MKKCMVLVVICMCMELGLLGQVPKESELHQTFEKLDSQFFEKGFNQCDLEFLDGAIHKDLIFYHDQSGVQNKDGFFQSVKNNICGDGPKKPIRNVEKESLQVFPLYNNGELYGVIQNGTHHFFLRESGKPDVFTSSAKFSHLYLLEEDRWLLKEVFSFDHQNPLITENSISTDQMIYDLLKKNKVPAMGLGIINGGTLKQIKVYGYLKDSMQAPYNTIFKVASLTKPVVALVTLNLVSSGALDLDEPLYKYYIDEDVKDDKWIRKLTPRLVLSHQTGFPNWRYLTEGNKLSFEFEPGTKYQYSGEGFEYLRKALEIKFGQNIEALADSLIFRPAQMTDTHFWWDEKMDADRYAENHDDDGIQLETYKYYKANAAANLLTTVEDYSKFLCFVLNGGGLNEEVYQEMLKSQVQLKEDDYFGLGWEKLTDFSNGEYALLHSGRDNGVNCLAIIFPKSKNGYVIFLNGNNAFDIYGELLSKELYLGNELWDRK